MTPSIYILHAAVVLSVTVGAVVTLVVFSDFVGGRVGGGVMNADLSSDELRVGVECDPPLNGARCLTRTDESSAVCFIKTCSIRIRCVRGAESRREGWAWAFGSGARG